MFDMKYKTTRHNVIFLLYDQKTYPIHLKESKTYTEKFEQNPVDAEITVIGETTSESCVSSNNLSGAFVVFCCKL